MATKTKFIACSIKELPPGKLLEAADVACEINPCNRPMSILPVAKLAVLTTKYWGANGIKLTVGFMDSSPQDLRRRIVEHMNAWGKHCNAVFVLTGGDAQVRIARENDGYWSYLGTDILSIPRRQQTMNLQGFTMATPEAEFVRVVRHETGHTMGFPHEHMRRELVERLDVQKTIAYFQQTQGWDAQTTREQVLTPLSESSLMGTSHADQDSIMCYQLPGSITKDGRPIPGGNNFDAVDKAFANKIYPLAVEPPPPPPGELTVTLAQALEAGTYTLKAK